METATVVWLDPTPAPVAVQGADRLLSAADLAQPGAVAAGSRLVLLTRAWPLGGLPVGGLFLAEDHLAFFCPLRPPAVQGVFPDLAQPYDRTLRQHAIAVARRHRVSYALGVAAFVAAPGRLTAAECAVLRRHGAAAAVAGDPSAVVAARAAGARVLLAGVTGDLGADPLRTLVADLAQARAEEKNT